MRIIKKYPNRRLYDTTLGTYITLEDIKNLVIAHIDLKVIDAKTKKDLTQATLLQIIIDEESNHTPLFTTTLLQDFIRFYQEKSKPLFTQYLEQMMQLFAQQKNFLSPLFLKEKPLRKKTKPTPKPLKPKAKKTARKTLKKRRQLTEDEK